MLDNTCFSVFNMISSSSFVGCLVYESLSIFLYVHISKAFILPASVFDIVQVSAPQISVDIHNILLFAIWFIYLFFYVMTFEML